MPIIDAYGMRGNVVFSTGERAEGNTSLVFIHGAGGSATSWQAQLDYFNRSFNCLAMELPGHGAAQGPGAQQIKSYTLWVRGALDALQVVDPFIIGHSMGGGIAMDLAMELPGHGAAQGPGAQQIKSYTLWVRGALDALQVVDPFIIGHSMGGGIAMDLALRFPALPKGLVLASTGARLRVQPGILEAIKNDFPRAVERICEFSFATDVPEEMRQSNIAQMMMNAPDVLHGDFLACDRFDVMEELGTITVPTLVICGDQDALTPVKYARYLADRIAGSRLEIIEGAGHKAMVERPEQFNKRLEVFFRSGGTGNA
jgi:pimeloyl-ACP methyl ester carboxylesterase